MLKGLGRTVNELREAVGAQFLVTFAERTRYQGVGEPPGGCPW
jgi:hypothetical protein